MLSNAFNNAVTEGIEINDISALMTAATKGDIPSIQKYIDKYGAQHLDAVRGEPIGYTALMWAAKDGNVAGVSFMLDQGSSLERPDMHGETPLIIAAWMGRTELVLELLRRGADDRRRNDDGLDALGKALKHGHVETAEALRKFRADQDAKIASEKKAHCIAMEKAREVFRRGIPEKLKQQIAHFKRGNGPQHPGAHGALRHGR
ncbi:MAG TPA: ankyrin repeat domain-containing protein [Patescibacteria group bacterium]|nr:ankyrin repeat domain-containing protein [Patescibacteria group bacterium]